MLLPVPSGYREHDVGYVFFISNTSLLAEGIDWFQRWQTTGKFAVHHTGVVTGSNECVEAHWSSGIRKVPLGGYLDSKDTLILFRKPKGWDRHMGQAVADAALSKVGAPYDKGLILSQLASNTFAGHLLNKLFRGGPERWLARILDRRQAFICSELSAYALNRQPELEQKGILRQALDTISPQELWESKEIWD